MREDNTGSDFAEESKRKMGLLRLERPESSKRSMGLLRPRRSRWSPSRWSPSRWSPSESSKRSMGLLRLGRGDSEASMPQEDDKRSMQLLRLGRKRNDDYFEVEPEDGLVDQMRPRSVITNHSNSQSLAQTTHSPLRRLSKTSILRSFPFTFGDSEPLSQISAIAKIRTCRTVCAN